MFKFSRTSTVAVVILASILLAGCFSEPTRTVDWFKNHDDERQTTIAQCADNPGELAMTPNCQNAFAAEKRLSIGALKRIDLSD